MLNNTLIFGLFTGVICLVYIVLDRNKTIHGLKKGASVKNIFIYLGAFSSMKIPMLGIELGYLGIKFTRLRTLISLPLFILTGQLMEEFMGRDFKVNEAKA